MTFTDLQSRVASYLDRTDLTTNIINWINDARIDIALRHNFKYLYVEASAATVAGTKRYALPADYLGHLLVWCANKKLMKLEAREADELTKTDSSQTVYPRTLTVEDESTIDSTTTSGPPDYYIERGMEFELYPTPGSVYTMTVHYYQQPTTWTSLSGSSYDYMSTFHYEAVIWGASLRGAMFLDDDDNTAKFGKLYEESIKEMIRREKDQNREDMTIRFRTYKDYDLTQFKRRMKVTS